MIGRMTHSAILLFYAGAGPDHAGRRIDEILGWDHRRLEMVHDYIQWLFPLPEASRFNPHAPVLTQADIQAFRTLPNLQTKVLSALDVMLNFYGLSRTAAGITRKDHFDSLQHWLTPLNHNYLRLTRILMFLKHVGQGALAEQLCATLQDIASHEGRDVVSVLTLSFWREAVKV
jgi:hypothetical protein